MSSSSTRSSKAPRGFSKIEEGAYREPEPGTVGHRIWELRIERGLSIVELSRVAEVSHGTIQRIETNPDAEPDAIRVLRIAEALSTGKTRREIGEIALYIMCGTALPSEAKISKRGTNTKARWAMMREGIAKSAKEAQQAFDSEAAAQTVTKRAKAPARGKAHRVAGPAPGSEETPVGDELDAI